MDDSGDLSDWEILSQDSPTHFSQSKTESIAINHDYFTIDSINRLPNMVVSDEDFYGDTEILDRGKVGISMVAGEESGIGDGGCWEEMYFDVGFDRSVGVYGKDFDFVGKFGEIEIGGDGFGLDLGFRDFEEKQLNTAGESGVSEGIEGNGTGDEVSGEDDGNLDVGKSSEGFEEPVRMGDGEDLGFPETEAMGENSGGESVGEEMPCELGVVEPMRMEERALEDESAGESVAVDGGDSRVGVGVSGCEEEKKVSVLLKMPLDLLKFCVLKTRPVWSISIAAGIIGLLMLGRRLYKMKGKRRGLPLKISLNDKKNSQLVLRASRLNEGLSAVRRVPFVRLPPPAGSVSLWPVAGSLQALDW